jgi:hypothetical protein
MPFSSNAFLISAEALRRMTKCSPGKVIIFAPDVNGPLYRIAETGGTPSPITSVPNADGLQGHRWPVFLPDGFEKTFGEMSAQEKHGWKPGQATALSHRARAFQKFAQARLNLTGLGSK